ncbi:HAD-IIB family hydrolase [Rhizobium daejeonense]|uniref:HAD-IIB family hydrolase n=2 Tax=Rhizobium daejeonense TaxID=240521 RepID=A0A6M1S5N8_9HYPH|nr:HAD-IIB family hydrolase [Rhizobium daejeonense]NGO63728.1 HAD-IIB family hydrolase [Rhizobium daejeonense]
MMATEMPFRLFSADLDGTLAGDREGSRRFSRYWQSLEPSERPLLVYNSGRLIDDIVAFTEQEELPRADAMIGGVGTMLASRSLPDIGEDFDRTLAETGYDVERIEALVGAERGITRQPERYQHRFKSSWFLHDASPQELENLLGKLSDEGLSVRIVYSSNRDLDILPANADKGSALAWLCERIDVAPDEVIVAGDTGNDRSMFLMEGVRGIIPANGLAELTSLAKERETAIFRARASTADGVIEGLAHWSGEQKDTKAVDRD